MSVCPECGRGTDDPSLPRMGLAWRLAPLIVLLVGVGVTVGTRSPP